MPETTTRPENCEGGSKYYFPKAGSLVGASFFNVDHFIMADPELKEDQNLDPYQGELFPKGYKIQSNGWINYNTPAQRKRAVKKRRHMDWKKQTGGRDLTIEYD